MYGERPYRETKGFMVYKFPISSRQTKSTEQGRN
jgi:hypothetical protein